jgi:hypothetical protein
MAKTITIRLDEGPSLAMAHVAIAAGFYTDPGDGDPYVVNWEGFLTSVCRNIAALANNRLDREAADIVSDYLTEDRAGTHLVYDALIAEIGSETFLPIGGVCPVMVLGE